MIKRLVDSLRDRDGYAGMAVYNDGVLLFSDAIDPGLAARSRRLFEESEALFQNRVLTAVIRGFTVAAFRAGGLIFVCRSEGKFTRPPVPAGEEPEEYAAGRQPGHPMTREEARREAELMLRRLLE